MRIAVTEPSILALPATPQIADPLIISAWGHRPFAEIALDHAFIMNDRASTCKSNVPGGARLDFAARRLFPLSGVS